MRLLVALKFWHVFCQQYVYNSIKSYKRRASSLAHLMKCKGNDKVVQSIKSKWINNIQLCVFYTNGDEALRTK